VESDSVAFGVHDDTDEARRTNVGSRQEDAASSIDGTPQAARWSATKISNQFRTLPISSSVASVQHLPTTANTDVSGLSHLPAPTFVPVAVKADA
jgi:hypothetical protein